MQVNAKNYRERIYNISMEFLQTNLKIIQMLGSRDHELGKAKMIVTLLRLLLHDPTSKDHLYKY